MPPVDDWEDEQRIYISDEIRCSWTNYYWGTCIRNPNHIGRQHLVIGTGGYVIYRRKERQMQLGDLIEVPRYIRKTPLGD